ncbi:hypothetical protein FOMPIDRAFT_1012994 [Fomitopsis schrenkii]|uniref:Uncharacterized protein n=1 Tax=Fomitopsis schrenkii TaxID=2126942 RepID=S8FXV1_FOMSC|nr:hypothetical protein FOMPIDRAFT_1012994 [Fomitopsis schrenkii]
MSRTRMIATPDTARLSSGGSEELGCAWQSSDPLCYDYNSYASCSPGWPCCACSRSAGSPSEKPETIPPTPPPTISPSTANGQQASSSSTPAASDHIETEISSNTSSLMPTTASTTPPSTGSVHRISHHSHTAIAAGVAIPVAVIFIALTFWILRRRRQRTAPSTWFNITGILPKPGLVPIQSRFVRSTREPEDAPPAYERIVEEQRGAGAYETQ